MTLEEQKSQIKGQLLEALAMRAQTDDQIRDLRILLQGIELAEKLQEQK